MTPITLSISAIIVVLWVAAWWRIFARAGYPGPFALVMLVPVVNFVLLLMFAFDPQWPLERDGRVERRSPWRLPPRPLPPGDDWI